MAHNTQHVVLAVDLGKTSCRMRLSAGSDVLVELTGAGSPGLGESGGEDLAYAAVTALTSQLPAALRERIRAIGIGAAGVEAGPDAARSLAKRLSDDFGAPTALINDALAAHVGAFAGGTGTILITGTGAIAFSLDASGPPRQVDGWGPLLGDDGGGRWIGQEGIKAALRDHDGRSEPTSLTRAAAELAGDLRALPRWVAGTGHDARRLASFAPIVIEHAEAGDAIADGIIAAAVQHLVETVEAATDHKAPLSIIGGLFDQPFFHHALLTELTSRGYAVAEPLGSPLDGAALIAGDLSLPHESRIIRV